jgi:hypothetical protein
MYTSLLLIRLFVCLTVVSLSFSAFTVRSKVVRHRLGNDLVPRAAAPGNQQSSQGQQSMRGTGRSSAHPIRYVPNKLLPTHLRTFKPFCSSTLIHSSRNSVSSHSLSVTEEDMIDNRLEKINIERTAERCQKICRCVLITEESFTYEQLDCDWNKNAVVTSGPTSSADHGSTICPGLCRCGELAGRKEEKPTVMEPRKARVSGARTSHSRPWYKALTEPN